MAETTELSRQILARLQEQLAAIPFAETGPVLMPAPGPERHPDFELLLRLPGQQFTLAGAVEPVTQPRQIHKLLNRLKQQSRSDSYPVLGVPYMSPAAARFCRQAHVSYADLAGNYLLCFGSIYLEKRSDADSQALQQLRELFVPGAGAILQALLDWPGRVWKVEELSDVAGVSPVRIYRLKHQLLAHGWCLETAKGLLLIEPWQLLSAWVVAYRREVHERREFTTRLPMAELERRLVAAAADSQLPMALTDFAGAARYCAGMTYHRLHAYIAALTPDFLARLELRPVDSGGRLVLLQPADPGILAARRDVGGWPVVTPVQLYLDLRTRAGSEEAADLFLRQVIAKKWEEVGSR